MKKPFPHFTQLDSMSCGPACLRMIAKYYGCNHTLQSLCDKSFITREGVSLLGISDAAESIGFRTSKVKISFDQLLNELQLPCIIHWKRNHFVVCYDIKKKKDDYEIKISDPAGEKYSLKKNEFLKSWINPDLSDDMDLGAALILYPTQNLHLNEEEKKHNLRFFLGYLSPYKIQVLLIVIGMLIGSVIQMIFPFLTQAIVDQGINNHNLSFITLILIAQLFLFATQLGNEFIRNWIILHVNTRISISLISDFLSKLMKLPIRYFDSKHTGDIMQRIGDNSRIRSFLTGSTLSIAFSFFNFIVFAFILAYYNFSILSIFIIGNTLYVCWILMFLKYRRRLDHKRFAQASADQSNMVDIVSGMQEIKLTNSEKQQRWKWERIQVKLFKISMDGLALGQYQQIGSAFFNQTTSIIITFLAAKFVIDGNITLGMMMSISYITGQLSGPISQLVGFIQTAQDAKLSLERLNEIHNKEDEEQYSEMQESKIPSDKSLILSNVYFSYDGADRDYALKDINVVIPSNKVTAIVGSSGCGKTTLIKLLLGFYAQNKGEVRIGNVQISNIFTPLWRLKTGAVMQDSYIFSDTIVNNIIVGDDEADKERLMNAVEMANIRDFIESLPLKYKTKIGMGGVGISQGQKQRILIARIIYKNPDILFLDEATSALDANNEKIIWENLHDFYKGKTVIIVAHRLSTVQNADNIMVMENGSIVEEGTHLELSAKKGIYYTLVKNQLELGG